MSLDLRVLATLRVIPEPSSLALAAWATLLVAALGKRRLPPFGQPARLGSFLGPARA
jgi:hypothetical protein